MGADAAIAPDSGDPEVAISGNDVADAAALLAGSRELIEEARRILAGTYAEDEPVPTAPNMRGFPGGVQLPEPEAAPRGAWRRRLVAGVPAGAGIALLAAGLAAFTGGSPQHALTVDSRGPGLQPSGQVQASRNQVPSVPVTSAPIEAPVSVSVPRLHTQAVVAGEVQVETSGPEAGLLDAPPDYRQLGWYRHGDTGALVIDGHVGYRSSPGPLAFIGSLAPGDRVTVGFPSGDRVYTVKDVARAAKGLLPQQYFTSEYDTDLMLITCDYTSPFRAGHFEDNVYVVAVPAQ